MPNQQPEAQIHRLFPPSLGDVVRSRRNVRGYSQEHLAKELRVRTQTISAWEHGKTPQKRFFEPIADFLGVTPEQVAALVSGEGFEPSPLGERVDSGRDPRQAAVLAIGDYLSVAAGRGGLTTREIGIIEGYLKLAGVEQPFADQATLQAAEGHPHSVEQHGGAEA